MTPITQLGTVNVPEPRMVVINVWDKGMIGKIEKAIRESGIGINPVTDGPLIRLPIPACLYSPSDTSVNCGGGDARSCR